MRRPTIGLLGDWTPHLWSHSVQTLSRHANVLWIAGEPLSEQLSTWTEMEAERSASQIDAVVVAEQWPDQFTTAEVYRLLEAVGQTTVLIAFGPWCESAGRTRALWPQAIRLPVRQIASFISTRDTEFSSLQERLPFTSSRAEWFEWHSKTSIAHSRSLQQEIAVVEYDEAHGCLLQETLKTAGWKCDYFRTAAAFKEATHGKGRSSYAVVLADDYVSLPPTNAQVIRMSATCTSGHVGTFLSEGKKKTEPIIDPVQPLQDLLWMISLHA